VINFPTYIEHDKNGVEKSPFQLYKEAVNRTEDPKKAHLKGIEVTIERHFDEYGQQFASNGIHLIPQHGINEPTATMLKSLYSSKAALVKRLRRYFNNELPNRIYLNTCPYCTQAGVGTVEHILPKEDYPEYAINTLNLIPCCGTCNPSKGTKVKDDAGMPEFINFYYHDIQSYKFLYADISFDANGKPKFTFQLSSPNGSNLTLQSAIQNHFRNLHLLERYRIMADAKYAECESTILPVAKRLGDIQQYVIDYSQVVETSYGKNHYYSAMLRAMVSSSDYQKYLSAF